MRPKRRSTLTTSPAFRSLPSPKRRQLARDLAKVVAFFAPRPGQSTTPGLTTLEFPNFVGRLIEGTFKAIVDGSIHQVEAYVALVRTVVKSVEQFSREGASAGEARNDLSARFARGSPRATAHTARQRKQQRLAVRLLMGINRIVVTDGKINAKVIFR